MCVTLKCGDIFIALRRHIYVFQITTSIYVCHIVMRGICSSDCNVCKCLSLCDGKTMFITLWHQFNFITLWWKGYVHYIEMFVYLSHFATTRLCSSHCDINLSLAHCDIGLCSSHYDICICSSHYKVTMFKTKGKCSTHCDNKAMFITLKHLFLFVTIRW